MTKMTLRAPLSYAAGLAIAMTLTACGGSGDDPAVGTTTGSPSGSSSGSSSSTSGASDSSSTSMAGRTIAITVTGNQDHPELRLLKIAVK